MEIEAKIKSLKKILSDDESFYQIPDYQRPYAWNKDNLSELVDDLFNAYQKDKEEKYFCGSIVLVNNEEAKRYDVIDGQQRITTFIILCCVLRNFYREDLLNDKEAEDYITCSITDRYDNKKDKLILLTNTKHRNFFETLLKKIEIEKDPKNRYLQNAHYLKDFIQEKIDENTNTDINNFVKWLFKNVVLTTITCPNQDTAIQIFNVLNDRGMPLSSVDILKSSLMHGLSREEKCERNEFKEIWNQVNNKLEDEDLNMETLFGVYRMYAITPNSKNLLHKDLLDFFKGSKKDSYEIINEIEKFCKAYIETLYEKDRYIYCLKYLKHSIFWESILTTAKFKGYKDFKKLKQVLVAYYYLHWLNDSTSPRFKNTSLNIIKKIKKGESMETIITKEIKPNLEKWNIKFDNIDLQNAYSKQQWIKPLLLLLEYFSKDDSNQSFIEQSRKNHVEHVLPQNPDPDGWDHLTSNEKEKWTNDLANLTLLSGRKNSQASNGSFQDKKEVYKNKDGVASSFELTRQIFEKDKWGVKELEERN